MGTANLRLKRKISLLTWAIWGSALSAESIRSVKLAELFTQADQVALVKVVSGDLEHYDTAVYKTFVETAFKGVKTDQTLYVGPFLRMGVGSEYILFLKVGQGERTNSVTSGLSYGDLASISMTMYAGYGALAVGYECVFDGQDAQQCDDSVQLNPQQVVLPKNIKTYPHGDATAVTNYKKWVRKHTLIAYLNTLPAASK